MPPESSLLQRFIASRPQGFDAWHDGLGYDLTLLAQANERERADIESWLLTKAIEAWPEIAALAALGTARAREALRRVLAEGDPQLQVAVLRHAPELAADAQRSAALVASLEIATFFHGLTQALDQVETFHPPEVIDALWRGAREREGEVAFHFAAMLLFVHGKTDSAFAWEHRPFLLRFVTEDRMEREAALRALEQSVARRGQ
ncbi:hypothetical protein BURK2_02922 [Burkholderiales bacterium]|nr:MAG: hypothetical protein F9K47_01915 [Burkholderiales bacterium]CAG0999792.1 hypothetical protein BURK2_02922 [Burkholderiales bacterium]